MHNAKRFLDAKKGRNGMEKERIRRIYCRTVRNRERRERRERVEEGQKFKRWKKKRGLQEVKKGQNEKLEEDIEK